MKYPFLLLITSLYLSCSLNAQAAFTKPIHMEGLVKNDTVFSTHTGYLKSDTIPAYVFDMKRLKVLSISGSDCDYVDTVKNCWMIRAIPTEIKNLKYLKSLSLTINAIRSIPTEISALTELKYLDLTDNPGLSDISNVAGLKNLEELSLYGCNIEKIPTELGSLKKLRVLGLAGNHLSPGEKDKVKKLLPGCTIYF